MSSQAKLTEVSVGKAYETKFGGTTNGDSSSSSSRLCTNTPWLDDNESLQKRINDNRWSRWDGVEGSAQEHAEWILGQARSLTSEDRHCEFRSYGEKNGCQYYIHDALTQQAGGSGCFKIEGTLRIEPKDLLAFVFDVKALTDSGKTTVLMKVLKTYLGKNKGDPFVASVYWANAPGFPFYVRDGIDVTGYHKDEDGTVWQMATSVPGPEFVSQPGGLCAIDRYFAYKLEPNGDGTTKTTLICQTVLNGLIPRFLSNMFMCSTLIDYMFTIQDQVKERKASGAHQKMLDQLELNHV